MEPEILKLDVMVEKHEKFKDMKSKLYQKLNQTKKDYDFFVEPRPALHVLRILIENSCRQARTNQKCVELTDAGHRS